MKTANKVQVAVYQEAKNGHYYCGDSYFYIETEKGFVCAIADGLGSGKFAMESSQVVINIIKNNIDASIEQLIKLCNAQLFGKRGVVLGILKIKYHEKSYSFSSIGNIGVMTITKGKKKKRNIPNAGYLAGYNRPFKVVNGNLDHTMNFIMFSDGVTDSELALGLLLNENVEEVTQSFSSLSTNKREDDTTLIAIRYEQ